MSKQIFHFYQRKGYGKAAVKALSEAAVRHDTIEVELPVENEPFWRKCGFANCGKGMYLPLSELKRQRTKGRC